MMSSTNKHRGRKRVNMVTGYKRTSNYTQNLIVWLIIPIIYLLVVITTPHIATAFEQRQDLAEGSLTFSHQDQNSIVISKNHSLMSPESAVLDSDKAQEFAGQEEQPTGSRGDGLISETSRYRSSSKKEQQGEQLVNYSQPFDLVEEVATGSPYTALIKVRSSNSRHNNEPLARAFSPASEEPVIQQATPSSYSSPAHTYGQQHFSGLISSSQRAPWPATQYKQQQQQQLRSESVMNSAGPLLQVVDNHAGGRSGHQLFAAASSFNQDRPVANLDYTPPLEQLPALSLSSAGHQQRRLLSSHLYRPRARAGALLPGVGMSAHLLPPSARSLLYQQHSVGEGEGESGPSSALLALAGPSAAASGVDSSYLLGSPTHFSTGHADHSPGLAAGSYDMNDNYYYGNSNSNSNYSLAPDYTLSLPSKNPATPFGDYHHHQSDPHLYSTLPAAYYSLPAISSHLADSSAPHLSAPQPRNRWSWPWSDSSATTSLYGTYNPHASSTFKKNHYAHYADHLPHMLEPHNQLSSLDGNLANELNGHQHHLEPKWEHGVSVGEIACVIVAAILGLVILGSPFFLLFLMLFNGGNLFGTTQMGLLAPAAMQAGPGAASAALASGRRKKRSIKAQDEGEGEGEDKKASLDAMGGYLLDNLSPFLEPEKLVKNFHRLMEFKDDIEKLIKTLGLKDESVNKKQTRHETSSTTNSHIEMRRKRRR